MSSFMIAMLGAGTNTIHGPEPEEEIMERWLELTDKNDNPIWVNMRQVCHIEPRAVNDTRLYLTNDRVIQVKELPIDLVTPNDQ